jgi:predicted DNA-binding transcriptional regulator AlpA
VSDSLPHPPAAFFLSKVALAAALGSSPSKIDRLEARGILPPRRQLGKGRIGWLVEEVRAALEKLPIGPLVERTRVARAAPRRPITAKGQKAKP